MDKYQTIRGLSSIEQNAQVGDRPVFTDPWADMDAGQERRDNWMVSYIDILTLILTLFVLLLVLQPKYVPPVSDGTTEAVELSSVTSAEQRPVEILRDYETEAEDSIAPTETVDQGIELPLSEEFAVDTTLVGVEPTIFIENIGTVTAAALDSFLQPRQTPESVLEEIPVDPVTPAIEAPAKIVDTPAIHPSTGHRKRPQSNALETLLVELTKHSLDSRLKVSQVAEGMHLEVSDKILFAEGSAHLKSEGQNLLNELAQVLLQHQGMISVEGHTDDRPISSIQFPSNWELSSGRATAVTRHLINHGLDPIKLRAVGYADTRPLETNTTRKGRMRNRRVSLILAPAREQ